MRYLFVLFSFIVSIVIVKVLKNNFHAEPLLKELTTGSFQDYQQNAHTHTHIHTRTHTHARARVRIEKQPRR